MAKGITEAAVEEIKSRIDIVDLISSYGIQVKTAGASKKACCPFHHEKTPSFNINENRGFYHCFGCGESGDAIKFVMKMDGLTFVEAVRKLAGQCGVKIEEKEDPEAGKRKRIFALMAELAQFYRRCLVSTKEAELAREYLKSRDLGDEVQEAWTIGYAPNGVSVILKWAEKYGYTPEELEAAGVIKAPSRPGDRGYHRFSGRLIFSIRDKQGRVVAFSGRQLVASKNSGKYVNSPETVIFKKSNVLFGFDKAAGPIAKGIHHEAIVCEGQIDTIRLHVSGFPIAVASQGTAFTAEHVKMLKRVADQVTLVFDDDAAGHKATVRTAGLFLAAEMPVRVVSLPGGDDPDSFLRKHKPEEFQRLLDEAESIMSFQVRSERLKERDPQSIDAIARITKAILTTISQSGSAVIKASMVSEAAKLMGLPASAMQDELRKFGDAPKPVAENLREEEFAEVDDVEEYEPTEIVGQLAAIAIPPSKKELSFCEFLMANENSSSVRVLDGMIGELLPDSVFEHDFTRRFVGVWRAEAANGGDAIAPWAETLAADERKWFDAILIGQSKSQECGEKPSDQLEDIIRKLWIERLKRLRGELPANGDMESVGRRMNLTTHIKQLDTVRWNRVKEIISEYL